MVPISIWMRGGLGPASPHWVGMVLSTLSASLLSILAYPPWELGIVTAWLALIPLITVTAHAAPGRAALIGWCFGLISNLGIFSWVIHVPGIRWHHIVLLDSYLSLYPALWTLLVALYLRNSFFSQSCLACSWVVLEYVRSHAGFLAFPWMTLAQSQVDNIPLLQSASFFGEEAVSGLVVFGNLAIWSLIRRKTRLALLCGLPLAVGTVIGTLVAWEFRAPPVAELRVGAVGTAFPAPIAVRPDPLIRLQSQLDFLQQHIPEGAALVVLPESAIVNPQLFPEQLGVFRRLAIERHLSFVLGVAQATKFDQPPVPFEPDKPQLRSEAWIVTASGQDPRRHVKSQLVPFAESRPLKMWISWPEWLVPIRTEVVRGPSPRSFPIADEIRLGIMICWESFFAQHAKALVDDGATVLAMLANEAWFGSGAAGAQHNLTARMRAVEFRRSVVVSSNMGPPLVVNPYGQVLDSGSVKAEMEWASATLPIISDQSWYSRLGDSFIVVCALFMASYALSAFIRNRRAAVVRSRAVRHDELPGVVKRESRAGK